MTQIAKLTGLSVAAGTDQPFAHGLSRIPNMVALLHGCETNISKSTVEADATNVYLDNGGIGAENAEVLAIAMHSVADGGTQADVLTTTVAAGGANQPIPHGLNRTPSIVCLLFGSDANLSIGATASDATNVYITNGGGGGEALSVLVMSPHSIVS